MTARLWSVLCAGLLALILALAPLAATGQTATDVISDALGQGPAEETPADSAPSEPELVDTPTLSALVPDLDTWTALAARAEAASQSGDASRFALTRLRDELFTWRERFQSLTGRNGQRIATLEAQLAALGPVPETGVESDEVAARRAELEEALTDLRAPQRLAAEAAARANGLIAEVDALIRGRQLSGLTERGPSPFNPAYWPAALTLFGQTVQATVSYTDSGIRAESAGGRLGTDVLLAALFVVVAGLLLWRGRDWVRRVEERVTARSPRWRALQSFLISLGEIVVPAIGLFALIAALEALNLWNARGEQVIEALFRAGLLVIAANWLNSQLFPTNGTGPMRYAEDTRASIRRTGVWLSIGLGVFLVLDTLFRVADPEDVTVAVLLFPVQVVVAWQFFHLGRQLRTPPEVAQDMPSTGLRLRSLIGLLCMVVAIVSPVLTALGFASASTALFRPTVLTLAILGVLIVLQRLVYDIFAAPEGAEDEGSGPLLPVLIGFALFFLSVPFLALAWGARVADLREVWARVNQGVSLGEATLSPGDFAAFLVVFLVGYFLTRFVQGTLRTTVMPRTKLDIGGQNAIVAGVGYVGIALAAVIAITSAGLNLTSLAVVAGALSVGIGFGLQNIVQNFVSGIILLIERPISEGDMIEVNGQLGYVREISVRSTRIQTFDQRDVIVPNADLVSGQVTNWTRGNATGRLILPVGVAYGSDVGLVKDILLEVAESHPMTLADPPPQVFFMAFGDSSLNFEIRVILRDVAWIIVTTSEMNFEIDRRFREAGIEVPFPQRDLWLRNAETLRAPEKGGTDTPDDHRPGAAEVAGIEADGEGAT